MNKVLCRCQTAAGIKYIWLVLLGLDVVLTSLMLSFGVCWWTFTIKYLILGLALLGVQQWISYSTSLSLKDYLTDLPNRRALDLRLEYEYQRARRYKESFSILVVDIDYFKPFNDKYGHLAGDAALKELAGIMQAEVREIDLVSRFGGEEFVILLPGTTREEACTMAERIRCRVANHVFLSGIVDANLTVCIGVGTYTEDLGGGIETLLQGTDMRLYSAKSCGRNKVVHMG